MLPRRCLPLAAVMALCLAPALTGCGGDATSAPGEVSPAEAEALDDAAAMLDERRLPPEALPTQAPAAAPDPAPAEMTGDLPAQPD